MFNVFDYLEEMLYSTFVMIMDLRMRVYKRCSLKYKIKIRKCLLFLIKIERKIKRENVIKTHDKKLCHGVRHKNKIIFFIYYTYDIKF